ncbi:MAG: phosphatase PAP2 family protein [Acidimicrobiales bacterium]
MKLSVDVPETTLLNTPKRRWWLEVLIVLGFYVGYSMVRNIFGSASVSPRVAFDNAERIIDFEQALGLFQEERIQQWFGNNRLFFQFWNIFYGTLHFAVTIFSMVYLFFRVPQHYGKWRNTFATTTALALVGFATFPLMPPRLLNVGGEFGGTAFGGGSYSFVDSVAVHGGLWSFDSGTMQSISNQYAAMPSLHAAWATWCAVSVIPYLTNRWGRRLLGLYPVLTLFAIVVTGNHYWIDAAFGLLILGIGFIFGSSLDRALHNFATKTTPL